MASARGLVWNFQTDTCKREPDRYGYSTMDLSEELFYRDSRFVSSFPECTWRLLLYQRVEEYTHHIRGGVAGT